eukprot:TRINITY_DN1079_c0_g1_i3.p1 TRINITY_DN1079_c0_g1~~TRINITY_DN1079_c0_g1_i3.p1  ORF type:complete len:300 (+),score=59.94 TRINITY_DN1079_c0_g1_i3:295-1194(+)
MKNTRPLRNAQAEEQPTSPLMDGSWCVVDDSGSEGVKTPPAEKWENCEDEIQAMLAPIGVTPSPPPPPPIEPSTEPTEPSTPPSTPISIPLAPAQQQARQFQAHLQNAMNTITMAQSVDIPRERTMSTEHTAPLSRSLVTSEEEAMRSLEPAPGPVAKAAVRVAEWGIEDPQGEDSTGEERAPAPATPSQPASQPMTPALRPAVVPGRFWGDEKPISPALQSSTPTDEAPALSLSDPVLKKSRTELQSCTVHHVKPEPMNTPDDDFEEMIWTLGKYALFLGGALYFGNKARKRWGSSRA